MTDRPEQIFRSQRKGLVVGIAVTLSVWAVIGWMNPRALWIAVPLLTFVLAFRPFFNPGLALTQDGIEWFRGFRHWRYRVIPWSAVKDIRWGLFGYGGWIVLTVEGGRYERLAWGTPRRDLTFDLRPNAFDRGKELWDALHRWWLISDGETDRDEPAVAAPPDPY